MLSNSFVVRGHRPATGNCPQKGKIITIFLSFTFISPPSIFQSSNLFKYHQVAMGTVIEISLIADDEEAANKAVLRAFQEMKRIEMLMSPWLDSSDVTRINRSAGKERVKISPETFEVIQKAQEISELSHGGFDITVTLVDL
jgi:thiamine biosynthesis lipoprotein